MYFIEQWKVRQQVKKIFISDFHVKPARAKVISKMGQLEPIPKWLTWFRAQRIKISNFIHGDGYSLNG